MADMNMMITSSTATTWEDIIGRQDWKGLLEPEMDQGLRKLIVQCADFCQATYESFEAENTSSERGNTRHRDLESFFDAIHRLSYYTHLFRAVSFIYAASGSGDPARNFFLHPGPAALEPWDRQSNWMGYVAVSSDEASLVNGRREIYVVWRGTVTPSEWTSNVAGVIQASAGPLLDARKIVDERVQIHRGWYNVYTGEDSRSAHAATSARTQVRTSIRGLLDKYKGEKVSVVMTGHSLGGALATLSAFDIVENGDVGADVGVAALVFGCPQVGNAAFKRRVESHPNLNILHVNNAGDIVPDLPDSSLPFYVPISTANIEIRHSGNWLDVSHNHSLIVTLDALEFDRVHRFDTNDDLIKLHTQE